MGKGRAAEYLAFRGLINELPDVQAVLLNPEGSPVPKNPSARWLIACALAAKLNGSNFGQVIKYLNRLPQMFRVFSLRDALNAEGMRRVDGRLPVGYHAIHESRDFVEWAQTEDAQAINLAAGD